MKGYYMMITVNEDRMGNLHLAPVSEKHSKELKIIYGQTEVFAQDGMQSHRDILESLPKNAIRNMQGGWTATTRISIELFYHWIFCNSFESERSPDCSIRWLNELAWGV